MSDNVRIELVGEGDVILFSFVDRGAVLAVSEREFVSALDKLVQQASRYPRSQLRQVSVPREQ